MSRFIQIDPKLERLTAKLGAKLTKDRPEYPEPLRTFEERRIDWIDGGLFKAIIIQPNFESKGVNQKIWNVLNIAWADFDSDGHRPNWMKLLVEKQKFEVIESNIDSLLEESENNLAGISASELS